MPCLGLTSLHSRSKFARVVILNLCQCPVSGSRLCTVIRDEEDARQVMCQCPVSGSRLCTVRKVIKFNKKYFLCQCPVSGSRLCTSENNYISLKEFLRVSMPCLGLTSLHEIAERAEKIWAKVRVNALSRAHVSAPDR